MAGEMKEGVYGYEYYEGRQAKRALVYRLARRTDEVRRACLRYQSEPPRRVLDVGTADGLMLLNLSRVWPDTMFTGVDMSHELLLAVPEVPSLRVEANAIQLPFADDAFDTVVATAIIEHVTEPEQFVRECKRVLSPKGLFIVTTPDPFFEKIATAIGHLPDEGHNITMNLGELRRLFESAGLRVLEAEKFMMSPWGFPAELALEDIMKRIGLRFLLLNQLVIGQKV